MAQKPINSFDSPHQRSFDYKDESKVFARTLNKNVLITRWSCCTCFYIVYWGEQIDFIKNRIIKRDKEILEEKNINSLYSVFSWKCERVEFDGHSKDII
jgi:hypothetical protein